MREISDKDLFSHEVKIYSKMGVIAKTYHQAGCGIFHIPL